MVMLKNNYKTVFTIIWRPQHHAVAHITIMHEQEGRPIGKAYNVTDARRVGALIFFDSL